MARLIRDEELNEIFLKCVSHNTNIESINLLENSLLGLITEALDEADVKKVVSAIDSAEKQLEEIDKYFGTLENFDKGKIPEVNDYLKNLKTSLEKTRGALAIANFETGSVFKFLGQKITLPQLTQSAITVHTKAQDFIKGFATAVGNIEDNLGPLVKDDEDKSKTLRELSQEGKIPDEGKLKSGIEKAMKTALGGGFFQKIKSFFTKAMTGAEKKIMDELPELNIDTAVSQIADAFLDSSIDAFSQSMSELPKPEASDKLEDVAKESQQAEEEAAESSDQSAAEEKQSSGKEPPPLKDEGEAKEEQDTAQQELVAAVKDEVKEPQSPKDASLSALDSWTNSLSKTSQASLKAAGRLDDLKDLVGTALDDSAKAVESEVEAAIAAWRDQHEETLINGKRFSKKNFDSLQNLIPKLAGAMLKKANESTFKITKQDVRRIVNEFLNRKFYKGTDRLLNETKYTESEMMVYRLNKLAGLE